MNVVAKQFRTYLIYVVVLRKLALRVFPAVTRLTVYRWLHIMVAWMIAGPSEAKLFVARDTFNDEIIRRAPTASLKKLSS